MHFRARRDKAAALQPPEAAAGGGCAWPLQAWPAPVPSESAALVGAAPWPWLDGDRRDSDRLGPDRPPSRFTRLGACQAPGWQRSHSVTVGRALSAAQPTAARARAAIAPSHCWVAFRLAEIGTCWGDGRYYNLRAFGGPWPAPGAATLGPRLDGLAVTRTPSLAQRAVRLCPGRRPAVAVGHSSRQADSR